MQLQEPLTIDQVRTLPAEQRHPYVEAVRVYYPQWNTIMGRIQDCYDSQPYAAQPPYLMLVGCTGAGKSELAKTFCAKYPTYRQGTQTIVPVLRAAILPNTVYAGYGQLATLLLDALGDPFPHRGDKVVKTLRLVHLLHACGTRMLILDEIQHFLDRESQKVLKELTDWLKTLIKDYTQVACVLIGIKDDAEHILASNQQLRRLFGRPLELAPFTWNEDQPDKTIALFRAFLKQLESDLPLRESSDLWSLDMAQRCFALCNGVVDPLMMVIRYATHLALERGHEYLDRDLLAVAFEESLVDSIVRDNPFHGKAPSINQDRKNKQQREKATNHRSKAAAAHKETIKDLQ